MDNHELTMRPGRRAARAMTFAIALAALASLTLAASAVAVAVVVAIVAVLAIAAGPLADTVACAILWAILGAYLRVRPHDTQTDER